MDIRDCCNGLQHVHGQSAVQSQRHKLRESTKACATATIAASPAASFAAALASAATFADAKVPSADTFDRDSFATQTAIAAEAKAESSNRLTSTALTAATEACSAALYPAAFFVQMALDRARHRPGHWRSA